MYLFDGGDRGQGPELEPLAAGAAVLRRFALPLADDLWRDIGKVLDAAPLRQMTTPNGLRMSVAMSNCGALGWVSDRRGYRYEEIDPDSGRAWPAMPGSFSTLAGAAAE